MRSHNNLPVITDLTSAITTAPPTFVFLDLDLGGLQTHFVRIFDGLSFQFVDGTMQIPTSPGVDVGSVDNLISVLLLLANIVAKVLP